MKIRTVAFFIFMSLFCLFAIANADETTHKAAAEELLLLTNSDDMMKQVWAQVEGMMDQQFQQMGAPEDLKPIFKKYTDKMFKLMKEEYSFANIKDDLITIYVNTYTEDEIREISKFYKSLAGKKFLEKMPQLMQETMAITQKNMQGMIQKIQKISEEMAEAIKKLKEQKEG